MRNSYTSLRGLDIWLYIQIRGTGFSCDIANTTLVDCVAAANVNTTLILLYEPKYNLRDVGVEI